MKAKALFLCAAVALLFLAAGCAPAIQARPLPAQPTQTRTASSGSAGTPALRQPLLMSLRSRSLVVRQHGRPIVLHQAKQSASKTQRPMAVLPASGEAS